MTMAWATFESDQLAAAPVAARRDRSREQTASAAIRTDEDDRGYAPRTNPSAIAAVAAAHALLLWALVHFDVIAIRRAPPQRLAVEMVEIAPPPPPHEAARPAPTPKIVPVLIAPPPVVVLPSSTPPIVAAPPPPMATIAPPAPAAVLAAPAPPTPGPTAVDIMADVLDAPPPRFPAESRRLREAGTVRLRVVVSAQGRVAEVTVARSSGFDRLDDAAAQAVRRWRFRPRTVAGVASDVVGFVPVTFNPPH